MTDLLTVARVGELLHLSRSTVTRMAADGRLPAVKVGRQWRFHADTVARLLESADPAGASLLGERGDGPVASVRVGPDDARVPADVAAALIAIAATSLGVMMVVTDMEGRPVTPVVNPCAAFTARADDPRLTAECAAEWRELADDADLRPAFATGRLGFQCARAFVRSGRELVGMVLAGGVAEPGTPSDRLHTLDAAGRDRVLEALPTLAATLSRLTAAASPRPFDLP